MKSLLQGRVFGLAVLVLAVVSAFDPRKQTLLKGLTIQTVDRTRL